MSRKLHIYCYNKQELSTIDAPLSDVPWSLVVMVVALFGWFNFVVIVFRMHSNCQLSGQDLQKIITLCHAFV